MRFARCRHRIRPTRREERRPAAQSTRSPDRSRERCERDRFRSGEHRYQSESISPAPHKCIDAIEKGVKEGCDRGLAFERECFLVLVQLPESRALRHAFFGERTASKIADVPSKTPTRDIRCLGVVGAGTMGGGIAMNFINADLPVVLLETKQEALDKGIATIRRNYDAQLKKGKFTSEQVEARMALIQPTLAYPELAQADCLSKQCSKTSA